ncbi:hypothetical protein [Bosea sp. OK403]|uniref:hypothetical protein n=1 Tax=Bosea sp. OK403 TaxID=1855286 RepID=UPI0011134185|nr:hypothetical protein [Bosea sp. OK403]
MRSNLLQIRKWDEACSREGEEPPAPLPLPFGAGVPAQAGERRQDAPLGIGPERLEEVDLGLQDFGKILRARAFVKPIRLFAQLRLSEGQGFTMEGLKRHRLRLPPFHRRKGEAVCLFRARSSFGRHEGGLSKLSAPLRFVCGAANLGRGGWACID